MNRVKLMIMAIAQLIASQMWWSQMTISPKVLYPMMPVHSSHYHLFNIKLR